MKKKSKILIILYISILIGFLFLHQNPKIVNKIKEITSNYLEEIKNRFYRPQIPIKLQEEYLLPQGYLTTQVLHKKYYSLGYAEHARQSEWVAYQLKREMVELALILVKEKKITRSKKFFEDPDIKGIAPKLSDYLHSGYDRGHIVSSADMSFSKEAMRETYFLSNISPQKSSFNSGIWSKLEQKVRKWAISKEKIYIISAGILTENQGFIGNNKILIPKNFYKIVLSLNNKSNNYEIVAFIIPNKKAKDTDLKNYVVNVNSIEEKTKIDFFAKLDAKIKKIIKMQKNISSWELK
ncbi:DNA/RNA non-specific endonuclease [Borrelia recurrentis]|uniref:Endonuclease n=1 Tax=Borrelia recurrentis (strain A1) TaxID=412418 RepID=B5RRL6_BORRA|nr:DNA/RNA non-specific endonuclease [Borrelia recurrentis]ACH94650.1 endonuclease precursor [Borrelia recurrentis A1]